MKIVLIKPRYFDKPDRTYWRCVIPPMGLTSLAACLLRGGHETRIYDMEALDANYHTLQKYLEKENPDIVGIDIRTPLINKTRKCAEIARATLPGSIIIIGGPHAFLMPEDILNKIRDADFILRGEAEYTLPEALKCIHERTIDYESLKKIDGACFNLNGNLFISNIVPLIENLDELPLPAYELLPYGKYFELFVSSKQTGAMMTTRGCPYNCSFCDEPILYGHRVRSRSPESIVSELEILVSKHGIDYIIFHDSTFNYSISRVKSICREIIKRDVRVHWKIKARVDKVDREMLALMKKAGCRMVGYGVESACEKSLIKLNKQYTIDQVREAFHLTREAGIEILAYFMLGTDGESESDILKTIDFAIELDPDYSHFMITTPMPGSKMFSDLNKKIIARDWSDFYFHKSIVDTAELSHLDIKKLHRLAYIKFYLRPKYILKQIRLTKDFQTFKIKCNVFISMILSLLQQKFLKRAESVKNPF